VKKILLSGIWFLTTLLTFIIAFSILSKTGNTKIVDLSQNLIYQESRSTNRYQAYSSLPADNQSFKTVLGTSDARPEMIRQYLQKFKSPLEIHYTDILSASEQYKTSEIPDLWRYIVAIAQCESNLGHKIPEGSYNAWGLGIPTGAKKGLEFASWTEAINTEAKFLRKLIDKGLFSPEEWGPIYAPPSASNGGSWAKCVREFLLDLQ